MEYTILVADDEKEIRDLLRLYLENEKYNVIEAKDGKQALDMLRSNKVDLCLLDIMMPNIDGYHVLQELRKESNMPVIILSAKDADSEKILGLNLGADDYISKPFNPLEAIARVNSNIRRFYKLGATGSVKVKEKLKVRELELDTDACVLSTCFDLFNMDTNFRILANGCWSSGGVEMHEHGLAVMRRQFNRALDTDTLLDDITRAQKKVTSSMRR